jgi:hypothetical protein
MASKDTDSRKQKTKTDAFIQDYLSDVWGSALAQNKVLLEDESTVQAESTIQTKVSVVKNRVSEKINPNNTSKLLVKSTEKIKKQFSLIPTIKIVSSSDDQAIRTQAESLIILLTNLYFLRRPLSPKVRQYILNLSEQVIDDFNAAYWLQDCDLKEVRHEI